MGRLSAALVLALALLPWAARAEPAYLLRKIAAVVYFVEAPENSAKGCAADLKDVMATIKFYGEQSRLRWYDLAEARVLIRKDSRGAAEPPPPSLSAGEAEWEAWLRQREERQRAFDRSYAIPIFRMAIYPAQGADGCVAFVHVGLSAVLRGARIAHTGLPFTGKAEIWDRFYYLKGEANTFATQLKDVAERAVKEFLNDWSDANR
ncbi:MAG TPA: hypothetical protein VL244_11465 [Alphaproteobacteria bacterium]|nr:hypothetical protein [Alphaproteobacteria bacterium]